MKCFVCVFCVFASWLGVNDALAGSVTITSSDRDTTIFTPGTGNSGGGQSQMYAGTGGTANSADRALVHFDVADNVPSGVTVQSVTLSLTLSQVAGGGMGAGDSTPREIDLHQLSSNWGEGTVSNGGGQGGLANAGDATWINAFAPSTPWSTPTNTPGGKFAAAASGAQVVNNVVNTVFAWDSTVTTLNGGGATDNSKMVADVQSWLNSPLTNFGWILNNTDETDSRTFRAFFTREAAASVRPQLTITFAVPEPATGALMVFAAAALTVFALRRKLVISGGK
jgi:hypothetical protein